MTKQADEQTDDSMAYIARKLCGCMVAAVVDEPTHRRDMANEIRSWILDGLVIERVTSQYVRENWATCPHEARQMALPMEGAPESSSERNSES